MRANYSDLFDSLQNIYRFIMCEIFRKLCDDSSSYSNRFKGNFRYREFWWYRIPCYLVLNLNFNSIMIG